MKRPDLFRAFVEVDRRLAAAGVPPTSSWWLQELERFYTDGHVEHVARVGRGGAKSTIAAKCLTIEVLFGGWSVPRGERHWAVNVSVSIDEAKARLGQIAAYLEALRVPFEAAGEQITLTGQPLGFWSRAARIGAVSGPRVVAWSLDEAAKLSDADGANPAEQLAASLRAASVTHDGARGRLYSSPWGPLGFHFDRVEAGTDHRQLVSCAPSWVANPALLSEAATRKLEPHEPTWRREYLAEPSAASGQAFDSADVDAAIRAPGPVVPLGPAVLVLDPSSLANDHFAFGFVRWVRPGPREVFEAVDPRFPSVQVPRIVEPEDTRAILAVEGVGSFGPADKLTAEQIVGRLVAMARRRGASLVVADQRESFALSSMFGARGLRYVPLDWTSTSKPEAVSLVRRWLRDRLVVLPSDPVLRRELLTFRESFTASGSVTFGARRGGHDDRVALLITAALADRAGHLAGSPWAPRIARHLHHLAPG